MTGVNGEQSGGTQVKRTILIIPYVLSLVLTVSMFWLTGQQLPYTLGQQLTQTMLIIGALVWPAVAAPWLGLLPRSGRIWFAWLVPLVGFWATKQPAFGFLHGVPLPNTVLLPWLVLTGVAGMILVTLTKEGQRQAIRVTVPLAAQTVAVLVLVVLARPILAANSLTPGKPALPDLTVVETFTLSGATRNSGLAAFAWRDVLVVLSPRSMAWRIADSATSASPPMIRELAYDVSAVEFQTQGDRLFIVEKPAGRVRCFSYPTGDLLWQAEGLGTINQCAWTGDYGWFLDRPEFDEKPAQAYAVLHRVALADGKQKAFAVKPPPGLAWTVPDGTMDGGAQLGRTNDVVFVFAHDLPFIYRPAQGDLPMLAAALPPHVSPPWDLADQPASFGLSGSTAMHYMWMDGKFGVGATDLVTGKTLWSRSFGSDAMAGYPLTVIPQGMLISQAAATNGAASGLICYDPLTGAELWRNGLGGIPDWIEQAGDLTLVMSMGRLSALSDTGKTVWTHETGGIAYTLGFDEGRDELVVFESPGSQLPGSGYWGIETTLRLSDGSVVAKPENQIGSFNYMALDGLLVRTPGRRTNNNRQDQVILRLDGPEVPVRDPIRYTSSVFARPDLLVTACEVSPGEVKVYILGRAPASGR